MATHLKINKNEIVDANKKKIIYPFSSILTDHKQRQSIKLKLPNRLQHTDDYQSEESRNRKQKTAETNCCWG